MRPDYEAAAIELARQDGFQWGAYATKYQEGWIERVTKIVDAALADENTLIRDDFDLAVYISMRGSQQEMVLNLYDSKHRESLFQELHDLFDGSYLVDDTDSEDDEPWVTMKVRRMPAGYVASLPEHDGW